MSYLSGICLYIYFMLLLFDFALKTIIYLNFKILTHIHELPNEFENQSTYSFQFFPLFVSDEAIFKKEGSIGPHI